VPAAGQAAHSRNLITMTITMRTRGWKTPALVGLSLAGIFGAATALGALLAMLLL